MKIIMMGTGPFAVPTFRSLIGKHPIPALVTRPTKPVKRGKQPATPMRDVAEELGIEILEPDSVNQVPFVESLRRLAADLFVVCDYGQILDRNCLSASRLGGINLHGSLLPKYRGAAPVNWPIYFGDPITGVSVIHMTPKLDGGPILARAETAIGEDETAEQLEPRLAEMGIACVHDAIAQLERWNESEPIGEIQDSNLATPARRLRKSDGAIDWSRSAIEIKNQIRAFQPWPASYTFWDREPGTRIRLILDCVEVDDADIRPDEVDPGRVVCADGNRLMVACGDRGLAILSIQPAGKKRMPIAEFLRGYPIRKGDQLLSGANS